MFGGCSNDKGTGPVPSPKKVTVSGTVIGQICPRLTPPIDSSNVFPYTKRTGYPATLTFFGQSGSQYSVVTDSRSNYSLDLDTGTYTIVIETWHSWPYRYRDLRIAGDWSFDPSIALAYEWADTVIFSFIYEAPDTLTEPEERDHLQLLSDQAAQYGAGGAVDIENATRHSYEYFRPLRQVDYYAAPRTGWYVWEIIDASRSVLQVYPGNYPDNLSVRPKYYVCPFTDRLPDGWVGIDYGPWNRPKDYSAGSRSALLW
jgi:hypothetical protein